MMATEAVAPLVEACRIAEERHLGGLFDAYETFCAYGCLTESWKVLALQLTLYLESNHIAKPAETLSLTFRSEIPLSLYLQRLDEQFGFLVSDVIVALFHDAKVLATTHHIKRDAETYCIDVVPWERPDVSKSQKLVRQYLSKLQKADLYFLIEGVKSHLCAREYVIGRLFDDSWTPCSDSHIAILPRLDLNFSNPDAAYLKENFGFTRPLSLVLRSTPTFLYKATVRASHLLGSPRRGQSDGNDTSLQPIIEDCTVPLQTRFTFDFDEKSRRTSKRSSYSDYRSFITALTHRSGSSMSRSLVATESRRSVITNGSANKRSTMQTFVSWPTAGTQNDNMADLSQWSSTLKQKNIVPDPELENWSQGRGQHAEYASKERDLIPLSIEHTLGQTNTALVEGVLCMRVRLVRKVIRCNKRTRLKREDALQEVQQLYRAQHSHVVRLVGTYVIDDELAILTYPCADWSLEQFLAITPTALVVAERTQAISKFFTCLIKAVDFLHSFPIKHMDIKPQNILVRNIRHSSINDADPFKIYLTDFGSSRLYPTIEDSETDNWTPFTRAYAAQEVVLQERRGLAADIYSMGCVYAEMLATALDGSKQHLKPEGTSTFFDELVHIRSDSDGKPRPYYSKLDSVCDWLRSLPIYEAELDAVREWTIKMLNKDQAQRPSARQIADDARLPFPCLSCTTRPGPEAFEAANPPPPRDSLVTDQ